MPVHSAVAAANAINAANGPFPAYSSNSSASGGHGKKGASPLDEAVRAAEDDLPAMRLVAPGDAERTRPATPDFIEFGGAQPLDPRAEATVEHARGHMPHRAEDETEDEKRRKRDLSLASALALVGGTGCAAGVTALIARR